MKLLYKQCRQISVFSTKNGDLTSDKFLLLVPLKYLTDWYKWVYVVTEHMHVIHNFLKEFWGTGYVSWMLWQSKQKLEASEWERKILNQWQVKTLRHISGFFFFTVSRIMIYPYSSTPWFNFYVSMYVLALTYSSHLICRWKFTSFLVYNELHLLEFLCSFYSVVS